MTVPIVVLTAGGVFAEVIVNAVADRFGSVHVIREEPEARTAIFRRWIRLRGMKTAVGQIMFGPFQRFASLRGRNRRREILDEAGVKTGWPSVAHVYRTDNVNSDHCRALLKSFDPKVVLVVGTRMIRQETLAAISAPFINYHAGINPMYRGQYGGYWALAQGAASNFGVTVHLIDAGVDTGAVLYQARIERTERDTIATLHYLQVVAAVPLILRAIDDALRGRLAPEPAAGPSRQWFHPTLWQHLNNGVRRGLW